MTNQADYSKVKADPKAESDRLRRLDIKIGSARVAYKGNDMWIGLRGKIINGHKAATEYAKKLNAFMVRMETLR